MQESSCQWGSVSFGTQCCQYFGDKCSWQSGIHWPATGISHQGDSSKVCAHFHYLLVFEGKSSVQFLYYGQVSWGNITAHDSDPSNEKERSTCKKESVLLVKNVISSKIQYLINVTLHRRKQCNSLFGFSKQFFLVCRHCKFQSVAANVLSVRS